MNMTPSDIAREAAEAILRDYSVRSLNDDSIGAPIAPKPFRDYDRFPEMPSERLAALILSAAAKMVRETGACDAMLKARSELEYTWARLGNRDAQFDKTHAELCAALQSLRALTEQPGKP